MPERRILLPLFLALEGVLYVLFLYYDLIGRSGSAMPLKYAALLLCVLMSFRRSGRDGRLICCALVLTACADLFLLVLDRWYAVGVAFFCPVQLLYARRLHLLRRGKPILRPRVLLSAAPLALFFCMNALTPLTALLSFYFPQLLCNAAESLRLPKEPRLRCFSLGLWLFVCCDICVGLHNLFFVFPPTAPELAKAVQLAMWAFYLPSQILILLSADGGRSHVAKAE